ncbi:RNA methyltransferase [Algoriphagus sp.]|uniref:TrmH family RNA methyltransferase n=1 Tax=Algoriphagus sp. TaxID=1872435 RepID=UPI002606D4AA|nr:RNA methyltransferase [Algoriphagus sp.]
MFSKNTAKFIKSLHQKKYRIESGMFFVEGEKSVIEVLDSDFTIESIFGTNTFLAHYDPLIQTKGVVAEEVSQKQLESIGHYQSNNSALAVVKMKGNEPFEVSDKELILALDEVRDPGNLGTIIRIADWYGIRKLVFSPHTADFYNPKVIQSSMGSFTRVSFFYSDLSQVLEQWKLPIYGAFLGGESVHELEVIQPGVLVMGNESNGISPQIEKLVNRKLTIPSFGDAESLNVAIATAVLCDNFKRLMN